MSIEGKAVIITGASSGIGEATAKLLASKGARLALGARRGENLEKIAGEIEKAGGEAVFRVTDVTRAEDNRELVELAKGKFGRVDAIFLNAGLMPNAPLSRLKTGEWEQMVDVNLMGVLNGLGAVLPEFAGQKSGHVIATSSVAGIKVYPGAAVYCATKWAVRALMEALRMESAQEGTNIRATTVCPAAIETELLRTISDGETAKGFGALYERYAIRPESVAGVVAFALEQPEGVNVSEFTIGPTAQPW
ncbi:MAG: SDR family oxidoreductase [Planctomycetota bacterium]|jgi:NADP-dependent 3-hydroxy acid dehydrogenase YdfG|nr:SDR family oxidoreductase [Planctomycetota bacterium]